MRGPTIDPARYRHRDHIPFRRALLAVSDKTGLVDLARALADAGVELVSTGGTAATIAATGIPVTQVTEITGFPEHLDGRVRTLHPAVHSGLLADLRLETHVEELAQLGIVPFELVVVNLYPFAATVAAGAARDAVIDQIDIGGPAMVRAAAKNHANVAVVTSVSQYPAVHAALDVGGTTLAERRLLARDAFRHTAEYDIQVATWCGDVLVRDADADAAWPTWQAESWRTRTELRYGENAHQTAALLEPSSGTAPPGIAQATHLHGKALSYNNVVDADAAVRAAYDFAAPAVAIIKHANPCGIAVAAPDAPDPIADAHARAHACDPLSAFGGVVACNRPVTRGLAETLADIFTEVLVAPDFDPAALEVLTRKKQLRLLRLPDGFARPTVERRQVSGGLLVQQADTHFAASGTWRLVAGDPVDPATLADLAFAWVACRAVKSNGILLAADGASVGIGMGQVNRLDSCRLAVDRAGARARGAVAASDAFFPFADALALLLAAGVRAVVQPGGSVRDDEVIQAAQASGVPMYFTGERHFAH